jgi:hypothetical protein
MNFNIYLFLKPLSIVLGSVVGLAAFASMGTAAPASVLNPCPGIYYEEPYNSSRMVPQGCPPNAATRLLNEQGQVPIPPSTTQVRPIQPPLPESEQSAITTITLQAGRANVRLSNATNTQITYQAIGHTQQRALAGGEEVMLQALPAPVTLTFLRPDGGFVKVMPVESSKPGVLSLMLKEATGLNDSQSTVRIQSSGKVFAY